MRLLHTADWHLGRAFSSRPSAHRLYEERFRCVERLVELAQSQAIDALIVAGDVFDSPRMPSHRLVELIATLSRLEAPALLLPGNHDPHLPGGIWERPEWERAASNVIRLTTREPLVLDQIGLVVHPCPVLRKGDDGVSHLQGRLAPAQRAAAEAEGAPARVEIVVAHGPLAIGPAIDASDGALPIDLDAPALAAFDYVALGDWHGQRIELRGGVVRAAYPGTPEPCRAGERDGGSALIVDIDGPGAPPRLTTQDVASFRWLTHEARLDIPEDAEDLDRLLMADERPERAVYDVRLTGSPTLAAVALLDRIERKQRQRLASLRLHRDGLRLRLEPHELADLVPELESPVGRAVRSIAERLQQDSTQRRVAEAALRLVHELVAEGGLR